MEIDNSLTFSFSHFSAARLLFRALREVDNWPVISSSCTSTSILLSLSEVTNDLSWISSVDSEILCKLFSYFFSRALTLSWSVLVSPPFNDGKPSKT